MTWTLQKVRTTLRKTLLAYTPCYTHPETGRRSVQKQVRERAEKTRGELEKAENTTDHHCTAFYCFYNAI